MKKKICLYVLCLMGALPLSAQTAEDYTNSGNRRSQNGDYLGAIKDYTKAIQLDPDYVAAYNNRGSSLDDLGRYEEAIKDYTKAIQLDPDYVAAYNNRGSSLDDLGRYEEAIKDYTKAIQLDPDYDAAYNNRGVSFDNLGRYNEAIKDYTKAIQLDPDYVAAYNNRGVSFDNLGRYEEAIKDYTKAIQLDPDYDAAYNNRGSSLDDLGRYEEAIKDYTKAIQLEPNSAAAYSNRGVSFDNLGRYNEAIKDYTKAIQLDPDYVAAYNNRGTSFDNLGRYEEAIKDYTKAIQLKPEFALAKTNLEIVVGKIENKRTPRIWVVAVGIDSYEYPALLTSLDACVSNAYQFEGIFLQSGLAKKDQIVVLPNSKAGREEILDAIQRRLCNTNTVHPEDMVIFYFVGHGTILNNTSFGICPFDFMNGQQLISESDIVEIMNTSPARHRICLIESCKSENLVMGASVSQQTLDIFNNRRKAYPASLVMLTSTKVGEPSIQDRKLGGYFSHYLRLGLKGKADGKIDGKKDSYVSVKELFLYIKENVMRDTNNIQIPQLNDLAYQTDIPIIPVIEN